MLTRLTPDLIPAFTQACAHERVFGSRIMTALRTYGPEDARALFWLLLKDDSPAAALYLAVAVPYGIWVSRYYFRRVAYICPHCHTVFKPSFQEAFFARHTPHTRKLTCTACGHHGFCVETWEG